MTDQPSSQPPPPIETGRDVAAVQTRTVSSEPRRSATRWGIALVVLALVIGVAAAAVFLLAGKEAPSGLVGYAPKDATSWTQIRLDLPGDQRQKLGDVLAKFPGFADQSTLDAKLDEALDRLIRSATNDAQDYSTKIKPWFGGEIGIASGALPDVSSDSLRPGDVRALGLVTVTDPGKAKAWFADVAGDGPTATETYNGVELTILGREREVATAIVEGRVMLVGDLTSVKNAIDSKGEAGLDTVDRFKTAEAALTGDALVSFWYDSRAWADWTSRSAAETSETAVATFLQQLLTERVPDWVAGQVRADGDAFVVDVVNPHVNAGPARTNRISNIADNLPASAIAVLDAHDLGPTALDVVTQLRRVPGSEETFRQVDTAVGIVGGFDAMLGWMGDTAFVVTRDGTEIGGGLAAAPTDPSKARSFITSIKSLLLLSAGQTGITTRDETYNGATITYIETGGTLSGGVSGVPTEIALTVTDDVVAIGVGDGFVKDVLDAKPGASLADSERYKTLIARVGAENFSSVWLDVAAVREAVEQMARDTQGVDISDYETNIKPYVTPLDALVGASRLDGELDRSTIVLTVN